MIGRELSFLTSSRADEDQQYSTRRYDSKALRVCVLAIQQVREDTPFRLFVSITFHNLETFRIVPFIWPHFLRLVTRSHAEVVFCSQYSTQSHHHHHHHHHHHRHVHFHHISATLLFTFNQECHRQVQTSYLLHTYYSRWLTGKMRKTNTIFQYTQTQHSPRCKIVQTALRSATVTTSKTPTKWLSALPRSSSWLETNRLRYSRHLHRLHSFKLTHQGRSHADPPRKWQLDRIKSFRFLTRSAPILKSCSTSRPNILNQLLCSRSTRSLVVSTTWSTRDTRRT